MTPPAARILVVDDDQSFRRSTAELLRDDGYAVDTAGGAGEAGRRLQEASYDLILMDLRMPGVGGAGVVEVLRRRGFRTPVLMVSGYGTVESAVESLHAGADDFLLKPVDPEALSLKVAELLQRRPSEAAVHEARFAGMVGRSAAMLEVFRGIDRVANTDTTVLITGETGTGKELVARAIHEHSDRAGGPFLPVNCAALAEGLLESELFGHVRGAFTGAHADKEGLFRAAHRGTILLDEVGDMGLRLQQRLLRVLQEREVMPVGGHETVPVDVRVVAATHRDLGEEVREERFRKDLYYRLNVFRIVLPPLRERAGDVPLLVAEALRRLGERSARPAPSDCSPLAMRLLRSHAWPGNVRELFSVIEGAAIQAGGERIEAHHLPDEIRRPEDEGAGVPPGNGARDTSGSAGPYRAPGSDRDEEATIRAALREAEGVRAEAARRLGMSRTTLWRRMKAYGLD